MSPRQTPDPADLASPLRGPDNLDPLLERIGDARYVLLGEASHGTHEYYRWRAEVTKRLVGERGFSFVAVEGDWPDCFQVNTWVRGLDGDGRNAEQVLAGFDRWPTWMWANLEVAEFASWMRAHNEGRPHAEQAGFYGFDVYSLWASMRAILGYLEQHEPEAVETAKQAFRCFEPYREDAQAYAWATRMVPTSCEDEVVTLLRRVCEEALDTGAGPGEEYRFAAEQNAVVARNAERYYRAMIRGDPDSWNVRDSHMVDTLERLMDHHGPQARCIVWAHNTHIGDARATDMAADGLVNVGQLARERQAAHDVVAVGFGGHHGSVIAGEAWGAAMERMPVPEAREGSVEDLLHRQVGDDALLVFPSDRPGGGWLDQARAHRAIGVVYHPERERWANYVPTVLGQRYDAFLWFERTAALRPLGPEVPAAVREPESFPFGV
ncbi:MAG: erythromycin esterase family protein [Actinomycetota bacterium]|nr:erythromycin esterase family protein [Actinomycetota bacterium]